MLAGKGQCWLFVEECMVCGRSLRLRSYNAAKSQLNVD